MSLKKHSFRMYNLSSVFRKPLQNYTQLSLDKKNEARARVNTRARGMICHSLNEAEIDI